MIHYIKKSNNVIYEKIPNGDNESDYKAFDFDSTINANRYYYDESTDSVLIHDINLSEYQETKKESLRANCKDAIESLITSSALGSEHSYDCREIDQHNLQLLITAGNGGGIYTHNGTESTNTAHTHAQCETLLSDMLTHINTCRATLYTKISLVNAATTPDEVDAINWD